MIFAVIAVLILLFIILVYHGKVALAWFVTGAGAFGTWAWRGGEPTLLWGVLTCIWLLPVVILGLPPIRRLLVTSWLMKIVGRMLPRMGNTERTALEAGTVWFDGELFSGSPNWKKLLDFQVKPLSDRERAFLDGPVEELCSLVEEWQVEQDRDLPREVWAFLKRHKFFGMIIPEEHGGLGFSAQMHSAVVTKISSRSVTVAVTVMVPNSLGPAELILHYGTEDQKKHYLPRLARGEEIPCFALTGPEAGSDAAATQSEGVVCRGKYEGKEVLGMRLNWRKRYITLAPVATLIGLAFRLRDPEHLLGEREDLGITCALIPAGLRGVELGRRHDPLGIPFQNGPTNGRDVFVPLDFIIGGRERAGQGWRMLMESLAAGRSISLPALSVGGSQLAARVVSAYGTVREQFDTPIGRFEGIEEPLARIGGLTYLMNAGRVLTAGAVDSGERPSVVSAIVKAWLTEGMRVVVNDAMDIRAGAGICRGPRNILARAYAAVPIGITVEGANILTRSMIIYGQGAIRCHPFVRDQMMAVSEKDLKKFDRAFFGHIGFVTRNGVRALVHGSTGCVFAGAPTGGVVGKTMKRLSRASAAFALVSDFCMATLGGKLKRREKISGRLADLLAWMYLASATVKRFWDEGRPRSDEPFVRWACEYALWKIDHAFLGLLDNLPNRLAAWKLRQLIFPFGARRKPPSDALGARVARALLEDREGRRRLTRDIYIPPANEPGLGFMEAALDKAVDALAVEAKIRDAVRAGRIDKAPGDELVDRAVEAGIISEDERRRIRAADDAREEAIRVDAFDPRDRRHPADTTQRVPRVDLPTAEEAPTVMRAKAPPSEGLALLLTGGGARAAYQVGVLLAIAERRPDLTFPVLTGVSAGSINAAFLAGYDGPFCDAVRELRRKWGQFTTDHVYGPTTATMARSAARWLVEAVSGWRKGPPMARGVFEAGPLREFLAETIPFGGIEKNIRSGRLRAVALSTSSYASGRTTTFVQGVSELEMWERALHCGVRAKLTLDHLMASCAIPLIYPAVRLNGQYYGDGSVRQTSPLAPAIQLGARNILAIASGPLPSPKKRPPDKPGEYPTAAEAIGLMLDSAFLDTLASDAERLERDNHLCSLLEGNRALGLRHLNLAVLRPSRDLGPIADESRDQIPKAMSLMLHAVGGEKGRGAHFLSYLLFEPGHTDRLIDLGFADASAQWGDFERILED